jgi:hypothetical protein
MRIALFSDIHANLPALEAFSKTLKPETRMQFIALEI